MEQDYWLGRWRRGETGWHQDEVEPALVSHFGGLAPTRVLVPLCGKSLDLGWLASQGHDVLGVELSRQACEEFFEARGERPEVTTQGGFVRFSAGRITILCGDFFALDRELMGQGPIGAVYDRAALIALPAPMRKRYAAKLQAVLRNHSPFFLQVVIERPATPGPETGPPFSVSRAELERLHGERFLIEELSREAVSVGREESERAWECVYRLKNRETTSKPA